MPSYEASPAYRDAGPYRSGVLLVNSGTPDSLTAAGVRDFLRRLLSDRRTIEVPRAIWNLILYGVILPTRPARVLPKYRRVWTERGSPLLLHSLALRDALRAQLRDRNGESVAVELGMLYSTPDVSQGLAALREAGAQRVLVLPLFPQYSGTTNAATYDQVGEALRAWRHVPELHLLPDYCTDARYIAGLADTVRAHRAQRGAGEHLLMTFHGIPKSYVDLGDPYRRKCELTARALAAALGLADDAWSISFQSRVGTAEWLRPYTDDVIVALAKRGIRTLDTVCPGFAVDCLETIDEIGHECDEAFRAAGGSELRYIPALNAGAAQVNLIESLLRPLL
ncbi:MAG TPA: ferrochelatase [Steroidobacteraceae bacterium]|nr:ferrochelatase [Steroidobacteraceae bacterium]